MTTHDDHTTNKGDEMNTTTQKPQAVVIRRYLFGRGPRWATAQGRNADPINPVNAR